MSFVRRPIDPAAESYRWWVLAVTSIGALMASLTSGTLIIALPDILRDLHTDIFSLLWIVVGYTLVATVLLAGVVASALGAVASLMRGEHRSYEVVETKPALGGEAAR